MGPDPHGKILSIMQTSGIKSIIMLVLVSLLSSCSVTSYSAYSFEQLRAADYTLPSNVKKIVIAVTDDAYTDADMTYYRDSVTLQFPSSRLSYSHHIPGMVCNVFSEKMNSSDYMNASVCSIPIPANFPSALRDSILSANKADAMILVKKCLFSANYAILGMPTDFSVSEERANKLVSAIQADMSFILPNGASRDFQTINDTINWQKSFDNDVFPDYKEIYYCIAEQTGRHVAALLIPTWEKRHRAILGSNTKLMKDAVSWTDHDNWDNARNIWADVVLSGKPKDQARAAINMGLYYEREDNELESAMWFSKALDILQNNPKCKKMKSEERLAQRLFDRAIDRQHEKVRLVKQMNATE